jgi:hypothetical protein
MRKAARWYVYQLVDPRDGAPFYVGKGCGDRITQHEKEAAKEGLKSRKLSRIREIWAAEQQIQREHVAYFWDEQAAYDHETDLIEEIGLANLTNVLPGGQKAWERRQQARAVSRRKEKPVPPLHEQLAMPDAEPLLSRFAEWFKAGGHKGVKFGFEAMDPAYRFHAKLSDYAYNTFMPSLWKWVRQDDLALATLRKSIRPYGVEIV